MAADEFGDVPKRHALVGGRVIAGSCGPPHDADEGRNETEFAKTLRHPLAGPITLEHSAFAVRQRRRMQSGSAR